MAVLQDAYASRMPAFALGMIVNQELWNAVSRISEDATAIGFGRAVFIGAADDGATATPTAGKFEGVTFRDVTVDGDTVDTFAEGRTMPVLKKGVVAVQASKAVAKGAPAFVTPAGAFTDTASGNTALPNATFDGTTTAAGLVPLRLV